MKLTLLLCGLLLLASCTAFSANRFRTDSGDLTTHEANGIDNWIRGLK